MMILRVKKTWNESMLSRIVQLTEEAQLSKPKLQRWLDKFGEIYSKAVVILPVAVALVGPNIFKWPFFSTPVCRGSVYRALGLMVAASPCALAVAPLAYATAISACARKPGLGGGKPMKALLGSVEYIASLVSSEDESNKIKKTVRTSTYGGDFVRAALSVNNKVTVFHFEDRPRSGASDVSFVLQDQAKLRMIILTGDDDTSAWRVANAVGIKEIHCNLKPEDKLYHVSNIPRNTGGGLVMVGDGINDAPALAAVTVGIVLADRASATAVAVADVLLLQDNSSILPFCIANSRQRTALVKQNLALALSSILLASLTSVLGFLSLWLTVLLHEGDTLLVCLNSVRA